MLFNSVIFILVFLPITVFTYYSLILKDKNEGATIFLIFASLFFYAWWDIKYIFLIIFSVIINYFFGYYISNIYKRSKNTKLVLALGVIFNICLLGFFKYTDLLIFTLNEVSDSQFNYWNIILPLAISFFTFQQIAYLVDTAQGKANEHGFIKYALFVTFFPQLIAGPIVHHSEMMPQFNTLKRLSKLWENIAVGVTIFVIGLFKKVILAEQMSYWADKTFSASSMGVEIGMLDAWTGLLCFSFQIYFDFSGYTDMATGAARLFGIKLPINFFSPYRASSIINFWRCWHITLSRFLRDYVYFPLGGNKFGTFKRFRNIMIVMLLGGLWHGAGYNFIIWGGLHGLYLIINHSWRYFKNINKINKKIYNWFGRILTFLSVSYAWVYFRSDSLESATNFSNSLFGLNGIILPTHYSDLFNGFLSNLEQVGVEFGPTITYGGGMQLIWLVGMFCFVWLLPNTQEIMHRFEPTINFKDMKITKNPSLITWIPNALTALIMGCLAISLVILIIQGQPGEFIYFQF